MTSDQRFEAQFNDLLQNQDYFDKIEKSLAHKDKKLLSDQMRDLSLTMRQKLIAKEIQTQWIDVLWFNTLEVAAMVSMMQIGFILIVVTTNTSLPAVVLSFGSYLFVGFLFHLISGLLNNQS